MRRCTFVLLGCLMISSSRAEIPVTLQGQLGGESRVVALSNDGTLAYLGVGPRVVVLDLSTPDKMREIGQSEPLPSVVEDIVVAGDYAFVADGRAGLYVLDLSDAAAPKVVSHSGTPSQPAWKRGLHVCLSGKHAYFADGEAGLRIFDISNPADPAGIAVLDVWANDVAVADGHAYVASFCEGLAVFDVSDPAHPKATARIDTPICIDEIEFSGGYAFITGVRVTLETVGGLFVVDVREPAWPAVVGRCDLASPGDLAIAGKLAYVANGWGGVEFIRITNPALPARVGGYDGEGYTTAVAATDGQICITGIYAGLEVIDVSHLAQPVSKGRYATTNIQDVAVSGAYAYVASTYSGMQVVDIANPGAPAWVSWLDLDYANCVATARGCVCVGDGWRLKLIDVSNPLEPNVAGECEAGGDVYDIEVEGTYVYAAAGNGLTIVNISNPQSPSVTGRCEVSARTRGVCVSGRTAYLAGTGGLNIVDISNPAKPLLMSRYSEGDWPSDVALYGDYAYLADGGVGMRVIDVSDPWLPGRLRDFDTYFAQDIVIEGNYGYLTDSNAGLQIFNVSNPGALARLGGYDRAGFDRIAVSGDYIYAADHAGGLVVLKTGQPCDPEPDGNMDGLGLMSFDGQLR